MNEVRPKEMSKEELLGIIDEYRDKNVELELELSALQKQLCAFLSREDMYIRTIKNLSGALWNMMDQIKED